MAAQQSAEPEPAPELVILVSREGDEFEVQETVALVSPTITRMIEGGRRISLPTIRSKILSKVIEFAEKLVDSRATATAAAAAAAAGHPEGDFEVDLSWGTDLVRIDPTSLTNLVLAADYLEMEELLHLSCERAAEVMAGKTPEEVQKLFSLKCLVTPAEEAEIRSKNKWAYK